MKIRIQENAENLKRNIVEENLKKNDQNNNCKLERENVKVMGIPDDMM